MSRLRRQKYSTLAFHEVDAWRLSGSEDAAGASSSRLLFVNVPLAGPEDDRGW
jgi:hypothetical protein